MSPWGPLGDPPGLDTWQGANALLRDPCTHSHGTAWQGTPSKDPSRKLQHQKLTVHGEEKFPAHIAKPNAANPHTYSVELRPL